MNNNNNTINQALDILYMLKIREREAAQMIEELIAIAKQMRSDALPSHEASRRGEQLGLSEDKAGSSCRTHEAAFYDALASNDSAVQILGDETLKKIAQELVECVRKSVSLNWSKRENARAQLRVLVKRTLRKYGYPPNKQATELVLEQAEILCSDWVVSRRS
jgi:type I restriction enzyme R subunit